MKEAFRHLAERDASSLTSELLEREIAFEEETARVITAQLEECRRQRLGQQQQDSEQKSQQKLDAEMLLFPEEEWEDCIEGISHVGLCRNISNKTSRCRRSRLRGVYY